MLRNILRALRREPANLAYLNTLINALFNFTGHIHLRLAGAFGADQLVEATVDLIKPVLQQYTKRELEELNRIVVSMSSWVDFGTDELAYKKMTMFSTFMGALGEVLKEYPVGSEAEERHYHAVELLLFQCAELEAELLISGATNVKSVTVDLSRPNKTVHFLEAVAASNGSQVTHTTIALNSPALAADIVGYNTVVELRTALSNRGAKTEQKLADFQQKFNAPGTRNALNASVAGRHFVKTVALIVCTVGFAAPVLALKSLYQRNTARFWVSDTQLTQERIGRVINARTSVNSVVDQFELGSVSGHRA